MPTCNCGIYLSDEDYILFAQNKKNIVEEVREFVKSKVKLLKELNELEG